MSTNQWHLVTYDVRNPKRLYRTAKILLGYGERVQYSVFRVRVSKRTLEKLRWELQQVLADEDNLLIIPLCERCAGQINRMSKGEQPGWDGPPPTFEIL